MSEISATEASNRFADMLEAVEHRGETFTVVRRGRAIATIAPAHRTTLRELREFLTANPPDPDWEHDLKDLRRFVDPAPPTDPRSDQSSIPRANRARTRHCHAPDGLAAKLGQDC